MGYGLWAMGIGPTPTPAPGRGPPQCPSPSHPFAPQSCSADRLGHGAQVRMSQLPDTGSRKRPRQHPARDRRANCDRRSQIRLRVGSLAKQDVRSSGGYLTSVHCAVCLRLRVISALHLSGNDALRLSARSPHSMRSPSARSRGSARRDAWTATASAKPQASGYWYGCTVRGMAWVYRVDV